MKKNMIMNIKIRQVTQDKMKSIIITWTAYIIQKLHVNTYA